MENITQYLITVTGGAALCAVIRRLAGEGTGNRKIIDLISGAFIIVIMISPLKKLDFSNTWIFDDQYYLEANSAVLYGENEASNAMSAIIKEQTESYILDKAQNLNANISVNVTMSGDDIPTPKSVTITGDVSPYAKSRLKSILKNDLGLDEEVQTWI